MPLHSNSQSHFWVFPGDSGKKESGSELHKMGLREKSALKNRGELSELEILVQEWESSLSFGVEMYLNIKHYFSVNMGSKRIQISW